MAASTMAAAATHGRMFLRLLVMLPGISGATVKLEAACSFTKIGHFNARIFEQARRAIGKRDRTAFHHVAAVARLQREFRILFDQEQRNALPRDCSYGLEYLLHHDRCESHAGLIEQQ